MKQRLLFIGIAFAMLVLTNHAQADLFDSPSPYLVGGQPWSVFSADLDGDGYSDLATVSYQTDSLTILLNAGDGTFLQHGKYLTGDVPVYVHGADLNGDTAIDLAVSNKLDNTVSLFINNGDGTFATPVTVAAGTSPTSVRLADFNGDNSPDLVVTNEQITMPFIDDSVSVMFNNGDGTFQTRVSFEVGVSPQETAAIDLNGDTSLDLAVVNLEGHTVSILLNDGSGSFTHVAECESNHMPSGISAADLDNDGDLDLVAPNSDAYDRSVISVILNNGDGTFQATIYYNSGGAPIATFTSDLDNDTDIDIVVANWSSDSVSILLNNGDATFQPPIQYAAGDGPASLFAANLNDDNYNDMVVTNRNSDDLLVYLNQGSSSQADDDQTPNLPVRFKLAQNYPNPFNPSTVISYSLPTKSEVTVSIYNVLGQQVRLLYCGVKPAGNHLVEWDGSDETGKSVATGVYLYRLQSGNHVEIKKMLLLK